MFFFLVFKRNGLTSKYCLCLTHGGECGDTIHGGVCEYNPRSSVLIQEASLRCSTRDLRPDIPVPNIDADMLSEVSASQLQRR